MKDLEAGEDDAENQPMDEDEELAVTGATIQTIDPYSKQEFKDPVKNQRCGHSYEKEIILNLMATNPRVKCYWMGCVNRIAIKPDELIPDDELRRYIARLKAQAAI